MSEELPPLSDRELEIVRLLATGATNQQIARELVISFNTVKVHLRNIYAKLDVSSRTEATMVAVREGWLGAAAAEDEPPEQEPEASAAALPPLMQRSRWPWVAVGKRIALVAVTCLTVLALILPRALDAWGNNRESDPIEGVFPTATLASGSDRWRTRAQMPTPRTDLAVAAHRGLVYAIGGVGDSGVTGKVEVYDPQSDAWQVASTKPTAVGFVSAAILNDRIVVPGGIDGEQQARDIVEVYDPALDAWETWAPLPQALGGYGLAVLDDDLYLFGGWDGREYVPSVYRYDGRSDRWETLVPMAQPRAFVGATALEGRIYVVGGFDGVTELARCDVYEPVTGFWTSCPPMLLRRGGLALVAVRERLYALGGGMTGYLAFNETYDPRLGLWDRIESPVTEQWWGLGAAFANPYVYALGGWNGSYLSLNESYQAIFQIMLP